MRLIFIILGMLFGPDGIVGIYFDNYQLTSIVSYLALVSRTFYGGFRTNWNMTKKSAEIKKDDILVLASNSFDNLLAN